MTSRLAAIVAAVVLGAAPASAALPTLTVHRAKVRAAIAADTIAHLAPLRTRTSIGFCQRPGGSRRTVDCVAGFAVEGRPTCYLTIRVRFVSARSRKTVATYPSDPVCAPADRPEAGAPTTGSA